MKLQAQLVTSVADRFQSLREGIRLAEPVAHAVGEIAGEPAGVEPEEIAAGLGGHLSGMALPGLRGPRRLGPVVAVETLPKNGHSQRPRLLLGRVMKEHQAAEAVVRRRPVALPAHQQNPRAANRLAGMQQQVSPLHAAAEPGQAVRPTLERGRPLAGPADGRK